MKWSEDTSSPHPSAPAQLTRTHTIAAILTIVCVTVFGLFAVRPVLLLIAAGVGDSDAVLGLFLGGAVVSSVVVVRLALTGVAGADRGRIRAAAGWGLVLVMTQSILFLIVPVMPPVLIAVFAASAVVAAVAAFRPAGPPPTGQTP